MPSIPTAVEIVARLIRPGDALPIDGPSYGLSDANAVRVDLPDLGPTFSTLATVVAVVTTGDRVSLRFDLSSLDGEFAAMSGDELLTVIPADR